MKNAGGVLIDLFIVHVVMLIAPCICQFPAHKSLAPDYCEWVYGDPEAFAQATETGFRVNHKPAKCLPAFVL